MSFDCDPRDEISAEEHYGEMEIKQLREINAELLMALKVWRSGVTMSDTYWTNILRQTDEAVARAEGLK